MELDLWGRGGRGGGENFSFLHEDSPPTPTSHNSAGPVPLRTNARTYLTGVREIIVVPGLEHL